MLKKLLCLIIIVTFAGCGVDSEIAPLSGKATFKGQPLTTGTVMLQPVQGGKFSRADIQPDGTFVMKTVAGDEGARVGLNRIRVTCYPNKQISTTAASDSGGVILGKSLIPEHYTYFSSSDLTVEVLPEDNPPLLIDLTD